MKMQRPACPNWLTPCWSCTSWLLGTLSLLSLSPTKAQRGGFPSSGDHHQNNEWRKPWGIPDPWKLWLFRPQGRRAHVTKIHVTLRKAGERERCHRSGAWCLASQLRTKRVSMRSTPGMLVRGFSPHSPIPQAWANCAFSPTGFASELISLSVEHSLSQLPQYPISREIKWGKREGRAHKSSLAAAK